MFIWLLTSIINATKHTKYVFLSNQKCPAQTTLLNDLSKGECVPNKTEDLNLSVFNMTKGINESKSLTKHILCECKCKFDSRKRNSNRKCNNDKCWCECKNKIKKSIVCAKKDKIWNPTSCSCENGKHLANIIDNSVITCDEIIETIKTVPTKTVPTKSTSTNFYWLP